ncbi:MAG: DUF5011 domain-containing protein [Bacteroidota bacterium]
MKKIIFFISTLLVSSLFIVGCGGGSSSGTTDSNDGGDTTAPVITILGDNPVFLDVGDPYTDEGATAEDDVDGPVPVNVSGDVIDTSVEGAHQVIYTAEDSSGNIATKIRSVYVGDVFNPPSEDDDGIIDSPLACETTDVSNDNLDKLAEDFNASRPITKRNVSSTSTSDPNRHNPTSHNTPEMLGALVVPTLPSGEVDTNITEPFVHPILVSYNQQIVGDYEMGDGSADIGDPEHVDGVFVALSLNNGNNWIRRNISDSTDKTSMQVLWDLDINAPKINYPGHAQKPTMVIEGNNILVAWNDKYCPSGDPLNLEQNETDGYPTDYFKVNGTQGSIDYAQAQDGSREVMIAPNGKEVYEVPFSCVWTARGFFNEENLSIDWHQPMQLTTGLRDSNHINLAASEEGISILWHEDTVGLKSGKGAGPGEGWSGATTGHGTDIWYTSIKFGAEFEDINETKSADQNGTFSLNNFHYPVRITDNEKCALVDETKLYCEYFCDTYLSALPDGGKDENAVERCLTYDTDMLTGDQTILDGDTGASRPALTHLTTNAGQTIVVMGYEETKGLSLSDPGTADQDQGATETNISAEGKSVYFESFTFGAIDDVNLSHDFATIMQTAQIPMVSAGNIVNVPVPSVEDPYAIGEHVTGEDIFENARRLVIGTQIDQCDAAVPGAFNFAFMYKQSFETQGASSDMFIRLNDGLTYEDFTTLGDRNVTNVSAQMNKDMADLNTSNYVPVWDETNLDDQTWENPYENTFSPRIFLRKNNIYTGYEYTPDENATAQEHFPSNFHAHIYRGDTQTWDIMQNVTQVTKADVTTVDARFFTTPRGDAASPLHSDWSNPNVLFVTWGTVEGIGEDRAEADLHFTRSTDDGVTWEFNATTADTNSTFLAARDGSIVQEKEVESFASPDGLTIYNVWLQEVEFEDYNSSDPFHGLDTWFGRVDFNESIVQ